VIFKSSRTQSVPTGWVLFLGGGFAVFRSPDHQGRKSLSIHETAGLFASLPPSRILILEPTFMRLRGPQALKDRSPDFSVPPCLRGGFYRFWRRLGPAGRTGNEKLDNKNGWQDVADLPYLQRRVISSDFADTFRHAVACLDQIRRRMAFHRTVVPLFRARTGRPQGCSRNRSFAEESFLAHRYSRSQHNRKRQSSLPNRVYRSRRQGADA